MHLEEKKELINSAVLEKLRVAHPAKELSAFSATPLPSQGPTNCLFPKPKPSCSELQALFHFLA
jgi:hypothetical protein